MNILLSDNPERVAHSESGVYWAWIPGSHWRDKAVQNRLRPLQL